ncbi:TatD family hydrolase [Rheinheimera sp.]|uniref:TatD family hydrolase n=1 Tax=Rheinheimera sp. TaxID=1869214 RepID=UPI003AF6B53C
MHRFCDAGVNLFSNQFDSDRAEAVDRARQQGVQQMLLISSDTAESVLNHDYCQQYPGLVCTAGVHPHQAASVATDWVKGLRSLLAAPAVVAVGECGLDFNRDFSPRPAQLQVFEQQLQLASLLDKPVYLHERDAFADQLALLKSFPAVSGVAHCFTGDSTQLKAYLDLGLYIGITGWLCDERRNQSLVAALTYLPLDRILLETDAPYLLPRTLASKPKSRRNEPAFVGEVAAQIAQLKQLSLSQVAEQTTLNFNQVFRLAELNNEL